MIRFTVLAVPVAQPRQRQRVVKGKAGSFAANYTPTKHPVNAFKATVRQALKESGELTAPIEGPVVLECRFYLPRPKRLMRKKDPAGAIPHTAKPDRDNLEKSLMDALKGLAWRDDSQVFDGPVSKWYAEKDGLPRVEVEIRSADSA